VEATERLVGSAVFKTVEGAKVPWRVRFPSASATTTPNGTATSFNTVEGAKVPWWVRFPAASATTTAQRDSKEGRASVATEAGPSWRRTDLMLAPDEIIDG
jgi:hypothetical protein